MGIFNASQTDKATVMEKHGQALIAGEDVVYAFKTMRDFIIFTNWRVIHVDVQGLTGSKKQYLTIPYRSINAFSVESAGTLDLDAEVKIYLSGHPPVEFNVSRETNVAELQEFLAVKMGLKG